MHKIAISSLKGGVGKTTSTFHLAAALGEAGHSVLAIDADPEGGLTGCFGAAAQHGAGLAEVLCGQATVATAALRTEVPGVWLLHASRRLEAIHRRNQAGERVLLARMADTCDFVLIDCPSTPGVLLGNALTAADSVLIPVAARGMARGVIRRVIDSVRELRERGTHPELDILGILVNQYSPDSPMSRRVEAEIRGRFGALVFDQAIQESEVVAEATDAGEPVIVRAGESAAAREFRAMAQELAARASARSGFFGVRRRPGALRVVPQAEARTRGAG